MMSFSSSSQSDSSIRCFVITFAISGASFAENKTREKAISNRWSDKVSDRGVIKCMLHSSFGIASIDVAT